MTDTATVRMSLSEAMNSALLLAQSGNLEGARSVYRDVLASAPQNAAALMNLGVVHLELKEHETGVGYLERAYAADPKDQTVRDNLYIGYEMQAHDATSRDDKPAAILALRKIIRLGVNDIGARTSLEAMLAYGGMPARLSDYEPERTPDRVGRTILVACMPKSGSSWLVNAVHVLSGYDVAALSNAYIENDQDLFLPAVMEHAAKDKVVHQHCRATAPTLHLAQAYGMTPVVLVRNLADTLVSMRDFWEVGAVRNSFLYGDWDALDADAKHDALIRHLGPWYIQFYVSWKLAEREGQVAPHWVRYEDMIADKPGTLRGVADFCGLSVTDADVGSAVAATDGDRTKTRFNKGVAGRGAEAFTQVQIDALRDLTRPFPSIDFSPLGL